MPSSGKPLNQGLYNTTSLESQGSVSSQSTQNPPHPQSPKHLDFNLELFKLAEQGNSTPNIVNLIEHILAQASTRIEQEIDKELASIWSDNHDADGTRNSELAHDRPGSKL